MNFPPPVEILTRQEVAARCKVSVKTVDRWVKEGCPSVKFGVRIRRFRWPDVERWLEERHDRLSDAS